MDATSRCDFDGSRLGSVATGDDGTEGMGRISDAYLEYADELPIARVAVTTEQSRLSSSTGVGTDLHASTQALEDDGAVPAREGSSDIVRSGPRAEQPLAEPVSDAMVPIVAVNVAAESREQGGTQQERVRTQVVWGQG